VAPDLKRAEVWAVNKAFNERYHGNAPLPPDQFARQKVRDLPGDPVNPRLQRSYQPNTSDDTGGCLVTATRVVRVFPWVSSQAKYGQLAAEVLSPADGRTQDVAVLRGGARSMPTVGPPQGAAVVGGGPTSTPPLALAQAPAGTKAFTALGFTAVPTQEVRSQLQL